MEQSNLDLIRSCVKKFKEWRTTKYLSQSEVCCLLKTKYHQSIICRFENLNMTEKTAYRIMKVLENFMLEINQDEIDKFIGMHYKRFDKNSLEILNICFTNNNNFDTTSMAKQLNCNENKVKTWLNNKKKKINGNRLN